MLRRKQNDDFEIIICVCNPNYPSGVVAIVAVRVGFCLPNDHLGVEVGLFRRVKLAPLFVGNDDRLASKFEEIACHACPLRDAIYGAGSRAVKLTTVLCFSAFPVTMRPRKRYGANLIQSWKPREKVQQS
jgi:hypothetical protein